MIRKFARYYKPHWKLFLLDMICALLVAVCNLVYPKVAGEITKVREIDFVIMWGGVLLGIFILKAVLNYIIAYWGHVVGVRIQGDMRRDLFNHLQKLPFSYYDETKTGSIMSRLINDLFEISELAHHGPEDIFLSLVTMIGALVMVFTIHPLLSLVVIVVLPLIILIAIKLRGGMMKSFRLSREKTAEINSAVESSVSGIRVSKAYTAEVHENEKFNNANSGLQSARAMQYKAMSNFHTAMSFSMDFLYLLAFVAGGILYCLNWIQIDGLTAYVLNVKTESRYSPFLRLKGIR